MEVNKIIVKENYVDEAFENAILKMVPNKKPKVTTRNQILRWGSSVPYDNAIVSKKIPAIFDRFSNDIGFDSVTLNEYYEGQTIGWHIDEIEPVRRNHIWNPKKRRYEIDKDNPMTHPERLHIDNQNPSCASCNINKHSESLEGFRNLIKGFMKHLNERSTQYKIARRYGLVVENEIEVKFYFEKINEIN